MPPAATSSSPRSLRSRTAVRRSISASSEASAAASAGTGEALGRGAVGALVVAAAPGSPRARRDRRRPSPVPRPRRSPGPTATGSTRPARRPRRARSSAPPPGRHRSVRSSVPPPEDERRVLAAEPERVGQRARRPCATRDVGREVEALGRSGSGSSRLIVGGMQPSRIARIVAIASIAPAAPSVWPSIDLLAVTATSRRVVAEDRPDRLQLGLVALRRRRRVGVHVVDLGGLHARLVERPPRRPHRADAARRRQRDVRRVGGRAVADQLGERRRAARLGVLERLEDRAPPPPSPMTKPSRPWSNGREAASGSSLRVGQRLHRREAAHRRLVDARPRRRPRSSCRRRRAGSSPTPRRWRGRRSRRRTPSRSWARSRRTRSRPARTPTLAMPIGMKNGEIRSGPALGHQRARCRTACDTPPRPDPMITPVRCGQLVVEPRRAGRRGRAPGARTRARTGCSGRSAASPCGRGRRTGRSRGPRRRSARRAGTGRSS